MKRRFVEVLSGVIFSTPFLLAAENAVPNLNLELSKSTWYAVGGLVAVLILILIYWILQSRYKYS